MSSGGMILHNLKLARFNMGWNQMQLAETSGVSVSTISCLEKTPPSKAKARTAMKLAAALGVKVWQLASNEGSDLNGQERNSAVSPTGNR